MSDRYIWAGEIIDTGDGGVNLDGEETAGRMNELDRENTNLDAELTETLMTVAELMDENADLRLKLAGSKAYASRREIELGRVLLERFHLRRQLAEAYEGCIAAMWSVVMGKASPDTRTAFEFAEGAIRALIPPKEANR